ncbi:hypothetical protein H0H92_004653 [Tricholoma furcatifolium]|nr:hypothetical protein H0H92_004653 [Tricholoma furcatifolium]
MASAPKRYQPTAEQIALSEERKAKKLKSAIPSQNKNVGEIIERSWIPIDCPQDSLQSGQCIKEVDRLEKVIPALEGAGYAHHYAAGPGKKHGCLIAFKKRSYTLVSTKTIFYDIEEIRSIGDQNARCGRSFNTKNIGLLVSLRSNVTANTEAEGVIVATTHLFWHPRSAIRLFQWIDDSLLTDTLMKEQDFNFAPDDIAYSLLMGDKILPKQREILEPSYVVHMSVDLTVPKSPKPEARDGNEESGDPDKVITSARGATPSDGLLSFAELLDFFSRLPKLRSAYDLGLAKARDFADLETFGSRVALGADRKGEHEPAYTSYTHYWKTTLDYIFVLDPVDRLSSVVALLAPHRTKDLEHGIPKMGVSSSDHVSLAAEVTWKK